MKIKCLLFHNYKYVAKGILHYRKGAREEFDIPGYVYKCKNCAKMKYVPIIEEILCPKNSNH